MASPIRIISSMATKQVLADLIALYRQAHPDTVIELESVGGVDAAKRVQAGEAFDIVALASNAVDQLTADGKVVAGSKVDVVRSGVALAVRSGAPHPDIGSEAALKQAVLGARTLGYSTGPSGVQLAKLFERWGIAEQIKDRIVTAPPGVPVGSLVAKGEVALGFQQLSELMSLEGIDVLGPLPAQTQIITTFSAGLATASTQPDAVRALLAFLVSPATGPTKQRNGMEATG
ncbi:MAG: substrate-binding domain-containing protein [Gammaproteobacteria bacterium]|jgi:molybdate transport system substrate-binding protein|uniref:substrate-binding domain-containing protein n=1 Tax=Hydrogenophaga sp. TaxID=1904254 RepID=UPI0025BA9AB6|nr:substrate-binding domain-containing protein [Hydrogenophaga sp.]MBU4182106.1 substrate-binding domain-containing protein [Gammaproteobacteria bacterium]MBU4280522.1 substrate-binding domain-containing protein [Gammaproteobacteria bacterium]MBU4324346.1 substrate-binding domain-containing protein [Gammaproteobacteria bacterium]MBU4508601.1 substrate-binding domain-containing protein [Gammaproteobacteria bacterium]MCG2654766.1 substrate-binding domain-containing protein [Hydrogenophaga sp.]